MKVLFNKFDFFGNFLQSFPEFKSCSDDALNLLLKMLHPDPEKRISLEEILQHEFLLGADGGFEVGEKDSHEFALRQKFLKIKKIQKLK